VADCLWWQWCHGSLDGAWVDGDAAGDD